MCLQEKIAEHREKRRLIEEAAMNGNSEEACFTCGKKAKHISKSITPAGYRSFQCDEHAVNQKRTDLWGSDPGWVTEYMPLPAQLSTTRSAG